MSRHERQRPELEHLRRLLEVKKLMAELEVLGRSHDLGELSPRTEADRLRRLVRTREAETADEAGLSFRARLQPALAGSLLIAGLPILLVLFGGMRPPSFVLFAVREVALVVAGTLIAALIPAVRPRQSFVYGLLLPVAVGLVTARARTGRGGASAVNGPVVRAWMTRAAALGIVGALVAACSPPIGVRHMDPQAVQRQLTASELSTGKPSVPSRIVLQRRGLMERFDKDPQEALAALHREVVAGTAGPNELFALAELSFHHAQHGGGRPYDLAAAVYAWAFLFPDGNGKRPDQYDPRLRIATDLYNRAVTAGFEPYKAHEVELRGGRYELPFGTIDVTVDRAGFRWGNRELTTFTPVAELEVRGLRNRYREPGIGAALAAGTTPIDPEAWDFVGPRVKVPVTALLRIDDAHRGLATGQLRATLELYAASETREVRIGERKVPLEIEPTAALAYALAEAPPWDRELKGLLTGDLLSRERRKTQLIALAPYRPGLVPVVLVHGTASSPGRWAEMYNDLQNDPRIRERFQFWAFIYDTGNPIVYSAMLLRRSLREAVAHLDPEAKDACLSRMVVIGHSQGGLLTKMTAIDTGDRLWRNVSDRPLEEVSLKPETRALLREAMFIEPLPLVSRVVFIATPHRGSFQARAWVTDLLARLVRMPTEVTGVGTELLALRRERAVFARVKRIPTSVENMSPTNPFIRTLATIPVAPGVAAHSIIAVKGDGPPEKGNDGVVAYESAHVDGVESELVVRSAHSVQGNPQAIEEVRRILLLHDAKLRGTGDACVPGAAARS